MTITEIISKIKSLVGDSVLSEVSDGLHPHICIKPEKLLDAAKLLKNDSSLRFDQLRCITGVDWPEKNSIEVAYDLVSITLGHSFCVKVMLDRNAPKVMSVGSIWPTAIWHERECFDLLGVVFEEHSDLRRILLPEDWPGGYPLRKDYVDIVEYHGLKLNP
jgi:NADH-quinone oxidoreductase subunit C